MQRIIIKNFGAVKNADIEINNILILIGEQASGKSTAAKLIYFFKSFRKSLFNYFYNTQQSSNIREEFINLVQKKYFEYFGINYHNTDFEIKYYYSNDNWIEISGKKAISQLFVAISDSFFPESSIALIENDIKTLKTIDLNPLKLSIQDSETIVYREYRKAVESLASACDSVFNDKQIDKLYIIAGRNSTVSYSEILEKHFFATVKNKIESNSSSEFAERKQQTIDEQLLMRFIERVAYLKTQYDNKDARSMALQLSKIMGERDDKSLDIAQQLINSILKGEYTKDSQGEHIMVDNNQSVLLNNASSGQQEVIRILQDMRVALFDARSILRIIEEPEAHLFPSAQKMLVELFALVSKQNENNQFIITTHSPYILTVFNNLLFANRVISKNKAAQTEVSEIIPESFHLKAEGFNAYSLQNGGEVCETIFNQQTGLIKQTYLDAISDMLGDDFNRLYAIHAKSFAKQ